MINNLNEERKKFYRESSLERINKELIESSKRGELDIVQYLLTSKELKQNADLHTEEDAAFVCAASLGHVELVKYFLSSLELSEHANIHACEDKALEDACQYGHLEVVKYLLMSPELTEHADINAVDKCLMKALIYDRTEIIEFLIVEIDIERKETMEIELANYPEYQDLFIKRELNKKLKNALKNEDKTKLLKTKI